MMLLLALMLEPPILETSGFEPPTLESRSDSIEAEIRDKLEITVEAE